MPWFLRILIGWVLLAVAFWVTARIVPGIHVLGGVTGYLVVALVFGLINTLFGHILRIISLPFVILSFGLFLLILNGFLLWLASKITGYLVIDHFFWDAILGAIVLGLVSWVLNFLLHRLEKLGS
jgi:putative membrane protein